MLYSPYQSSDSHGRGNGTRSTFPCTQREGRVTIKTQYVSCCLSSTDVPRLTEQTIPVYYRVRRHWVSLLDMNLLVNVMICTICSTIRSYAF